MVPPQTRWPVVKQASRALCCRVGSEMADSNNSITDSNANQTLQRVVDGPHAPHDLAPPHGSQQTVATRRSSAGTNQQLATGERAVGGGNSEQLVFHEAGTHVARKAGTVTEQQQLAEIGKQLLEIQAVCDLVKQQGVAPQAMEAYFAGGLLSVAEAVRQESDQRDDWLDSLSIDSQGLLRYRKTPDDPHAPASRKIPANRTSPASPASQFSGIGQSAAATSDPETASLSWSQRLERLAADETSSGTAPQNEKPVANDVQPSASRLPEDVVDEEQLLATESRRSDIAALFCNAIEDRFADQIEPSQSSDQSKPHRGVFYRLASQAWLKYGIVLPKVRPQDWIVIGAIVTLILAGIIAVGPIRWLRGASSVSTPQPRSIDRQQPPLEKTASIRSEAPPPATQESPAHVTASVTRNESQPSESKTQVRIDQVTKLIDEMELQLKGFSQRMASEDAGAESIQQPAGQHSRLAIMDTTLRHESPIDLHGLLAAEQPEQSAVTSATLQSESRSKLLRCSSVPVGYSSPIQFTVSGLIHRANEPLSIEFPSGERSVLNRVAEGQFVLREGQRDLLRLKTRADQSLVQLTDAGRQAEFVQQLVQTRVTSSGDAFYLRPRQTAAPLTLSLARPQSEKSWPLRWPIDRRRGGLSLQLAGAERSPADPLQVSWIHPFNSARCEGTAIAVVHALQPDAPDLALKFEIATEQQLTCRVSYLARFAPNEPWWSFSQPTFAKSQQDFEQIKQQMVKQLAAATQARGESAQLVSYAKRQQLAQRVVQANAREQQIRDLEKLASRVHHQLRVEMELCVRWDDDDQPILTTKR